MRAIFLFIAIMMAFSTQIMAQFNDSTNYYMAYNGTGNINKTQSGDAYLLNNGFKFSVRKQKVVLNLNSGWLYGKQDRNLTNNDYSAGMDFNLYQKKPGLYYWGLGNYVSSYSLNILNQLQTGLGLAYTFISTDRTELNISNGILYETSKVRPTDSTTESYHTYRNSFRLFFKYTIGKSIVWDGIGFVQNSLNYKDDYIIKANTSLSFKLNRWLSLNTNLKYNQIEKTQSQNLLFSYGFKAETYF